MSKLVILPTFDLVTECMAYDELFKMFIMGGVKALIRDAVLLTSFKERSPQTDYQRTLQHHHSALVDYVLKRFDDSLNRRRALEYDEIGGDALRQRLDLGDYMSRCGELEMITQSIDDAVVLMMEDLFRTRLYHINERESRWSGRDLIIGVETLSSQWGRRRAG
jgi:hypothetical protein